VVYGVISSVAAMCSGWLGSAEESKLVRVGPTGSVTTQVIKSEPHDFSSDAELGAGGNHLLLPGTYTNRRPSWYLAHLSGAPGWYPRLVAASEDGSCAIIVQNGMSAGTSGAAAGQWYPNVVSTAGALCPLTYAQGYDPVGLEPAWGWPYRAPNSPQWTHGAATDYWAPYTVWFVADGVVQDPQELEMEPTHRVNWHGTTIFGGNSLGLMAVKSTYSATDARVARFTPGSMGNFVNVTNLTSFSIPHATGTPTVIAVDGYAYVYDGSKTRRFS